MKESQRWLFFLCREKKDNALRTAGESNGNWRTLKKIASHNETNPIIDIRDANFFE
jgi:hypothetical protein